MSRKQRSLVPSVSQLGQEINSELRQIIRKRNELITPIAQFIELPHRPKDRPKYQVVFERTQPIWAGEGLLSLVRGLAQPDERIEDRMLDFARAVSHLQDRLHLWARLHSVAEYAWAHAQSSQELMICADLINKKKHGCNQNQSSLHPWLGLVNFDLSNSGLVEWRYDGTLKESSLLVTERVPIRFWIDIYSDDGTGKSREQAPIDPLRRIGDAAEVIWRGFTHWLPLIERLGVLNDRGETADFERKPLREFLRSLCQVNVNSASEAVSKVVES